MKTYNTPATVCIDVNTARLMQSYTPSDSLGGGSSEAPGKPKEGSPTF